MRPVHRLLEKLREAKARKAAKALSARRVQKQDVSRQALIDRLCGELGKPPIRLIRR
jgi:hypothetical protein